MALIETLRDDFTGTTILKQWPGNGSISFPGTVGRLTCPNGMNCNWDRTYTGAPLLFDNVRRVMSQPTMPFFIETKLSLFTGTTNYRLAGLIWGTTKALGLGVNFYAYCLSYYKYEGRLVVDYHYPTGVSRLFNSGAIVDPASAPHWYRIYWNPHNRPLWIQELSLPLNTDQLCFAYSTNGITWTSIGTRTKDFEPVIAGLYCRKWETSAVNAEADFDYFVVEQYNEADVVERPQVGKGDQDAVGFEDQLSLPTQSGSECFDLARLEDQLSLPTQSGPERFDLSGVGSAKAITPTAVGLEDQGYLLPQSGLPRFDLSEISAAVVLPPEGMTFEEGLFVQLDNTDYIKGKYDGDGKELLGGTAVRHIHYYNAAADPWHSHGAGHYGAGRDGKLYYDGVECAPGDFGTVAGGYRRTAWAFPDGFNDRDLVSKASQITMPVNGTLRFTVNTTSTDIGSMLRWYFTGDFDVQVDYNIVSNGSGPSDGGLALQVGMDWNNYTYCRRRMFGGGSPAWDKNVRNNGSWVSYASVGGATASGKLRVTRVGSTVTSYYWTGAAWAAIGSGYAMTYNRPMWVDLGYWFNSTPTGTVFEFSNFTINSGTTTNLIGWAREAAGTYRGSLAEFPQHALIVSSGNGFDIIDDDTQKLWMRFRGGTNNLVGGDGNYYIRQAIMRDGTLLVAYRTFDSYGVVDGWVAWIDFTLDFVRLHRGPTYNDAGLIYNTELTTGAWPTDSPNGCIAFRNSGRAFFASHFDNWQFQNSRANWADLQNYLGYQYRAIASNAGVYVSKWKRWKFYGTSGTNENLNTPEYGTSIKATAMQWVLIDPSTRDLYYHDRSKLYIAHWATWNIILSGYGGSWLEDHEYTLSGSRDTYDRAALAQDVMALDSAGGKIYYARNEGVYVMDVTTGVSTLIYGKVGSGAVHEVLGEYASVSSVALATDGATPILLVGMARPDRVWAVNLSTHLLYWKSFQDDAHQPLSIAVGA